MRKHKQPILCPRCHREFADYEMMSSHAREMTCDLRPQATVICVSRKQEEQLSHRSTHKTNEERWYGIFKILFPGDPLPPSPYLDATVSEALNLTRELFLADAPAAISQALEMTTLENPRDFDRDEIHRIVRTVSFDVFERTYDRVSRSLGHISPPRRNAARDSGIGSNTAILSPHIEIQETSSRENIFNQQRPSEFQAEIAGHGFVREPITTQEPTDAWPAISNEPTGFSISQTGNLNMPAGDPQNLFTHLPSDNLYGQEFSLDLHPDLLITDSFSYAFNE